MKKLSFFIALFLLTGSVLVAQVGINNNNSAPDSSAMLDVKSTEKGVLLPRLTQAQILTISKPANGLIVFCTTDNKFYAYITSANAWKEIPFGSGTIVPPLACGNSLVVYHVSGEVAPVNKTVTYGTGTNIPGETSKCWITRNLGASQQAASVNDNTEPSAGWYWQFNRKQGYMNDGMTLTPPWTITSINESSDWVTANDPCTIELGSTWRIPSFTEWYNVDNAGGWTTWIGPWNSGLKIHAAGFLDINNGSLGNRGSNGYYWCRTQLDAAHGSQLYFDNGACIMSSNYKAYGFSLRCLRE